MTTFLLDSDRTSLSRQHSLQDRLDYHFDDVSLLELALRHRSWCSENGGVESNERLEFLGDSVLGVVITAQLYRRAPLRSEGILARNRSELVSTVALAEQAQSIDLGGAILLGKGEDSTGGRAKSSILADAMEAVIGAVFLDGGLRSAERVVLGILGAKLDAIIESDMTTDYKSRLQELSAADFGELPAYQLDESGPEHNKQFTAEVAIDGKVVGHGSGATKKAAEQAAAHAALETVADAGGELERTDEKRIEEDNA